MSVRIVKTRNGDTVICDIREISQESDERQKVLGYQLINPYYVYLSDPNFTAEDDDGNIHKLTNPEIIMEPWAPLSKDQKIIVRFDEVISAYETHDDVIQKYEQLTGVINGRGNGTDTAGSTPGTDGGSDDPATDQSDLVETT